MVVKSVQLSYERYLSMDLSQYVGKWVAINQTGIVASSKSMAGLVKSLEKNKIHGAILKQIRSEEELAIL